MNTGSGEAADQMVRMMLSSGEVAVRLTGSAVKNLAAISIALARNHKKLSGRVGMTRMLRETRDLRLFPMSEEQYSQFRQLARQQKILYATVKDKDSHGKQVDLILPASDVERANLVFEKMLYQDASAQAVELQKEEARSEHASKKERRSGRDSHDTRPSSDSRTTAERPSVEARLKGFRSDLNQRQSAPARAKIRTKQPERTK
ncbi:MAG: DUF3801 domain-containing protein [Candidatus Onthomonas sp.]